MVFSTNIVFIIFCYVLVQQWLLLEFAWPYPPFFFHQDELDQTLDQFKEQFGDKPRWVNRTVSNVDPLTIQSVMWICSPYSQWCGSAHRTVSDVDQLTVQSVMWIRSPYSQWCWSAHLRVSDVDPLTDPDPLLLVMKPNLLMLMMMFSERRPARSDLVVLVAHNDDPTGSHTVSTLLYVINLF